MEKKDRFNVHFNTKGFMVLDYQYKRDPLLPDDTGIYEDEAHAEQIVIMNTSRPEARRVNSFLNSLNERCIDQDSEIYHLECSIEELTGFDKVDYLTYLIIKKIKETDNDDVKNAFDELLNDLDVPVETRIKYSKQFDNPDGYKYKYHDALIKLNKLEYLLDKKIVWCNQAIDDIIYGEKDSFIVKHDVAIKILKDLKKELEKEV